MTLPVFTNPNPDIADLRIEQERLRKQTEKLVKSTDLFGILSKYGELTEIGGSYKYGLMVYPDLDIGLVAKEVSKPIFAELVKEIVNSDYVRKVATADTINFTSIQAGRPKGYWLGLEIPFEGERWGIDCWFQQPEWTSGDTDEFYEPLTKLGELGRDLILRTKYDLIRRGLYGKTIFSGDVYNAVLKNDVTSLEDILKHLKVI